MRELSADETQALVRQAQECAVQLDRLWTRLGAAEYLWVGLELQWSLDFSDDALRRLEEQRDAQQLRRSGVRLRALRRRARALRRYLREMREQAEETERRLRCLQKELERRGLDE